MEIAKQIAGFSPAEADDLRKAIGKKIHSLMASLKTKFLEGCAASGTAVGVAQQLWADMEQAQDYSFNKSHAACYALIAYRTAWLKANYPCEYMAALISSVMNTKDKVPYYVNACAELGIEGDIYLLDAANPDPAHALWGGKCSRRVNVSNQRASAPNQSELMSRADDDFVEQVLSSLPDRDPSKPTAG